MARDERLEQRLGLTTRPRPVAPLSDPRPAVQTQRGPTREMFQEALMVRGVTDPAAVERAITALGVNEDRDLDRATAERYAALVVEHHAADLTADDNTLPTPDADLGRRGEQRVHLDALRSPSEWLNAAIREDRRTLDPHRFFRPER